MSEAFVWALIIDISPSDRMGSCSPDMARADLTMKSYALTLKLTIFNLLLMVGTYLLLIMGR